MASLTFDPESHTYHLGDKQLPSVTQILRTLGIIDHRWADEHAMARGRAVHQAIQFLVEDDLNESSVDPKVAPYLATFRLFLRQSGFKPKVSELHIANPTLQYAGTLDLFGELGGRECVVEIKTGKKPAWGCLQVTAYALAVAESSYAQGANPYRIGRFVLELRPNGTYRFPEYTELTDYATWQSCLAVYGWLRDHGCLNGGEQNNGSIEDARDN